MNRNNLEKYVWDESDFEIMGWHDCPIYGIQFDDNVLVDLDYIFQWILDEKEQTYNFSISPATLKFENCRNLIIDINLEYINGAEISEIKQEIINEKEQKYTIELQEGVISLISSGFKQFVRQNPIISHNQCLSEIERGGYSFDFNIKEKEG